MSRFLPNGEPDPSFGSGGLVVTDFPGLLAGASALALAADGKIVVAGVRRADRELRLRGRSLRFRRDARSVLRERGQCGRGRRRRDLVEGARAVVIEADGRIVLGGASDTQSGGGCPARAPIGWFGRCLFRELGESSAGAGKWAKCNDVVFQRDGKIVAAGTVDDLDAQASPFGCFATASRTRRSVRAASPDFARRAVGSLCDRRRGRLLLAGSSLHSGSRDTGRPT